MSQQQWTVFLSYAREDQEAAEKLYADLTAAGIAVWFDRKCLLPGQNWEVAIEQGVRNSRYFLALLSSRSVGKVGFFQKEVTQALNRLDEFPETKIYLLPVRLDDCSPFPSHSRLRALHQVDMFPSWEDGLSRILQVVKPEGSGEAVPQAPAQPVIESSVPRMHVPDISDRQDEDIVAGTKERERKGVDWRRLSIVLAVGSVPTILCFVLGWWGWGTLFLLATLLLAAFAFPTGFYPIVFTLYAAFAIAWTSGLLLAERAFAEGERASIWDRPGPFLFGMLIGLLLPLLFWLVVISVTSRRLLSLSSNRGISAWESFISVALWRFDIHRQSLVVENGALSASKDTETPSKIGGPGLLIVRPGNVVALERGGETRFAGPGEVLLRRMEFLKEPIEGKGIVDLRPQSDLGEAIDVWTLDRIPLQVRAMTYWQIEPKSITDARPGTRLPGGDATAEVYGAPAYPVYEAIIHKAVFNTPPGGAQAIFPGEPIRVLRDVIGTYTRDQIFSLQDPDNPQPEQRMIHRIEQEVKKRFDPSGTGVFFKGIDCEIRNP